MLNIHDLIRLSQTANASKWARSIVFDGNVAVGMNHAAGPQSTRWWAGVPFTDANVKEPVPVPVDTIKAHLLKSRHMHIEPDHVSNKQGLRTEWKNKPVDWSIALSCLPPRPEGLPLMFDLPLDALDRVLVAVDENDKRPALHGVFMDFETGRLAGTDGARVHLYDNQVPKLTRSEGQSALQIIVPKAPAHWLLKSSDKLAKVSVWKLGAEQSLVMMQTSQALVYTVAIDGSYPDVMRVIPPRSSTAGIMRMNPGVFSDAVDAMRKVSKLGGALKSGVVTVHWGASRVYANRGPDFKAVEFERVGFDAYPPADIKNLYASYNPVYLADAADCVTDKADWLVPTPKVFEKHGKTAVHKTGAQVLAVFEGDFSAVVMPLMMQLDKPPTDKPEAEKPKTKGGNKPGKKEPENAAHKPGKPEPATTEPPKAEKPATEPENKPEPAIAGPEVPPVLPKAENPPKQPKKGASKPAKPPKATEPPESPGKPAKVPPKVPAAPVASMPGKQDEMFGKPAEPVASTDPVTVN